VLTTAPAAGRASFTRYVVGQPETPLNFHIRRDTTTNRKALSLAGLALIGAAFPEMHGLVSLVKSLISGDSEGGEK